MPKPKKRIDVSPELDAILGEPITDADRLAEYLKRKAAEPQKQDNGLLFGDFTLDLDFDVPLIKKQQQPKAIQLLGTENVQLPEEVSASTGPAAGSGDSIPVSQPPNIVNISPSRRSAIKVPNSDRLRRNAIRRRSQSCGRRQLLKEFDNVVNQTDISSTFFPTVSSTPSENKKQPELHHEGDPDIKLENAPQIQTQLQPEGNSNCNENDVLASASMYIKQAEAAFHGSFNMDRSPESSRLSTTNNVTQRRTYTIENKGNQSKALREISSAVVNSPTSKSPKQNSIRLPLVRLQRISTKVPVPPVPAPRHRQPEAFSQSELDVVVPETQPEEPSLNGSQSQKLGEIIQNLSRSTSMPLVVIPINSLSPKAVTEDKNASIIAAPKQNTADVVSRSMQTSAPQMGQNAVDLMTDDDSDDESGSTTAPLNLASRGGKVTVLKRLRKGDFIKPADNRENSMQLLNLHQTNPVSRNRKATLSSVLNKAPSTPINGEKFAEELARMSNYEILDLRKRNSMGLVYPLNGQRKHNADQQALEENLEIEILRRNLVVNEIEPLPTNKTLDNIMTCVNSKTMDPPAPAPPKESTRRSSRSRSRRHQPPLTKELANYMALEETMQQRRTIRRTTKRSLYTKGDSESEDHSSSPEKQQRLSLGCTDAVLGPQSCEDFAIVPPPPASLRYSQSLRELQRSTVQKTKKQQIEADNELSPPTSDESDASITRPQHQEQSPRKGSKTSRSSLLNGKYPRLSVRETTLQEQYEINEILDALPPPADFVDHHRGTLSPRQVSEIRSSSFNKQNTSSQPKRKNDLEASCLSITSRNNDLDMVHISNDRLEDEELLTSHSHTNSVRVKSLEQLTIELPNRSRSSNEKQAANRRNKPEKNKLSLSKNPNMKKPSTSLSGKTGSQEQEIYNSDGHIANNVEENVEIDNMEDQLDTPTPSNQDVDNANLDDQPSTSRTAREALQRSTRQHEQSQSSNAEVIFKKPLAPAPRAKKKKTALEKQLANLKITIPLNGTMMEVDAQDETAEQDTTIRRSKRGQVPLRHAWCHTVKDLSQFDFFRSSLEKKKNTTAKTKKSSKANKRSKLGVGDSGLSRPPLCSSTPCSADPSEMIQGNRYQSDTPSSDCSSIGVAPFSDLEENQSELTPTSTASKQRKGATRSRQLNKDTESEIHLPKNRVPPKKVVEVSTQYEPEQYVPSAVRDISDNDQTSNQFTSWLHGSDAIDNTTQFNENQSSIVKEIVFKNLEGIDYAFYNTIEKTNLGYMRFKPHQRRERKRCKAISMKFIVQYGQFSMEIKLPDASEVETFSLSHGEMIEILTDTYYSITNMLDRASVLLFIRADSKTQS